jgi:hypothetical protein
VTRLGCSPLLRPARSRALLLRRPQPLLRVGSLDEWRGQEPELLLIGRISHVPHVHHEETTPTAPEAAPTRSRRATEVPAARSRRAAEATSREGQQGLAGGTARAGGGSGRAALQPDRAVDVGGSGAPGSTDAPAQRVVEHTPGRAARPVRERGAGAGGHEAREQDRAEASGTARGEARGGQQRAASPPPAREAPREGPVIVQAVDGQVVPGQASGDGPPETTPADWAALPVPSAGRSPDGTAEVQTQESPGARTAAPPTAGSGPVPTSRAGPSAASGVPTAAVVTPDAAARREPHSSAAPAAVDAWSSATAAGPARAASGEPTPSTSTGSGLGPDRPQEPTPPSIDAAPTPATSVVPASDSGPPTGEGQPSWRASGAEPDRGERQVTRDPEPLPGRGPSGAPARADQPGGALQPSGAPPSGSVFEDQPDLAGPAAGDWPLASSPTRSGDPGAGSQAPASSGRPPSALDHSAPTAPDRHPPEAAGPGSSAPPDDVVPPSGRSVAERLAGRAAAEPTSFQARLAAASVAPSSSRTESVAPPALDRALPAPHVRPDPPGDDPARRMDKVDADLRPTPGSVEPGLTARRLRPAGEREGAPSRSDPGQLLGAAGLAGPTSPLGDVGPGSKTGRTSGARRIVPDADGAGTVPGVPPDASPTLPPPAEAGAQDPRAAMMPRAMAEHADPGTGVPTASVQDPGPGWTAREVGHDHPSERAGAAQPAGAEPVARSIEPDGQVSSLRRQPGPGLQVPPIPSDPRPDPRRRGAAAEAPSASSPRSDSRDLGAAGRAPTASAARQEPGDLGAAAEAPSASAPRQGPRNPGAAAEAPTARALRGHRSDRGRGPQTPTARSPRRDWPGGQEPSDLPPTRPSEAPTHAADDATWRSTSPSTAGSSELPAPPPSPGARHPGPRAAGTPSAAPTTATRPRLGPPDGETPIETRQDDVDNVDAGVASHARELPRDWTARRNAPRPGRPRAAAEDPRATSKKDRRKGQTWVAPEGLPRPGARREKGGERASSAVRRSPRLSRAVAGLEPGRRAWVEAVADSLGEDAGIELAESLQVHPPTDLSGLDGPEESHDIVDPERPAPDLSQAVMVEALHYITERTANGRSLLHAVRSELRRLEALDRIRGIR